MVEIYHYMQTSSLLRDKFQEKKKRNAAFSIRSWANQMGLQSHGSLQQILAGKRTLPKKYIPLISRSLQFSVEEMGYFETLVDFEKAKNQEERDYYYQKLTQLRPTNEEVTVLEIENYKYFQNPLHAIVRTMMDRKDFCSDPSWIKEQLRMKVTENEIKDVLKRLITLGLVEEKEGTLVKSNSRVRNKLDVPSKAVQQFHQKMSQVAAEQVSGQRVDEREYNSFSLNMDKRDIPRAKEKIRKFVNEFMDEFELNAGESRDTYHINLQLFSLTGRKEH